MKSLAFVLWCVLFPPMALVAQPEQKKLSMMQGILVEDFLVNDDTTGGAWQCDAAIAMDGSGNFVVALGYRRNSSTNTDIYFQRYDSFGGRRGSSQKVNDDSDLGGQAPTIAMDSGGNFAIAWDDLRDENNAIYFQRYDASGVKQGNNQKVNDDAGSAIQASPTIAMDGSGNFVIAWEDYRDGNFNIKTMNFLKVFFSDERKRQLKVFENPNALKSYRADDGRTAG